MKKNKNFSLFKGITKNIIILGFVSLFTDLSSQMVFPLIPLYLTTVIGSSASIVGLIEGAAETTASLFKVLSGYFSDKFKKRKIFVIIGYSLSSFIKPLFAFAKTWPFVFFIRIFERIGKGVRDAPRDAIITESVDKSVRGKAYGFHRAMDGIGSMFGALIAFLLLPILGYKKLFLFSFFPGIMVFIILFFIKKTKNKTKDIKRLTFKLTLKEFPTRLKRFIFVTALFTLGNFGYAFLLLKAKTIGLQDNIIILFYILYYLIYSLLTTPFGVLSDKIGRKKTLILGYLLFILTSVGLIFSSNLYGVSLCFVLYGIFFALTDGSQRAFISDIAPKNIKATALGVFYSIIGLLALPSGFIFGFIWDYFSPTISFLYSTMLSVISLILFLIFI